MITLDSLRFARGVDPIADAFTGTGGMGIGVVVSDVVKVSTAHKVFFVIQKGIGTSGTSTVTVDACDDASPTNHTAVAFRYRTVITTDAPGAVTAATSAGFTTTAGSGGLYIVEVDCKALAAIGYKYVALRCTEVVDSPVAGAILTIIVPRYADSTEAITA